MSKRRGPVRRDPIPSPPRRVLRAAGGPARACQYIGDAKGNAREWAVCGKRPVAGKWIEVITEIRSRKCGIVGKKFCFFPHYL